MILTKAWKEYQLEGSTHLNKDVSQYIWLDSKKGKSHQCVF